MRLSAASRAVSIRIGTPEVPRIALARSKPDSPGIITSRMSRSKLKPINLARASAGLGGADAVAFAGEKPRQQIANAAVVIDHQQVRRIVWKRGGLHARHF